MIEPLPKPKGVKKRISKQWLAFRARWLLDNPPDYRGDYVCGICGNLVNIKEVQLDHIINRSVAPHQRFDATNVRPVHGICNYNKKARGQ